MAKKQSTTINAPTVVTLLQEKVATQLRLTPEQVKTKTIIIKNGEITVEGE